MSQILLLDINLNIVRGVTMIKINKDVCIGCGMCNSLYPEVFSIVDGKADAVNPELIDANSIDTVISSCPVEAIELISEKEEKKSKVRVLHFFAEWCGPCKMMEPSITTLENEGVEFEHINIDDEGNKSMNYNVLSIPTLIFLKDEKEVARLVGYRDLALIRETYDKANKEGA